MSRTQKSSGRTDDSQSQLQRGRELLGGHTPEERAAIEAVVLAPVLEHIEALGAQHMDAMTRLMEDSIRREQDWTEDIKQGLWVPGLCVELQEQLRAQQIRDLQAKIRELEYTRDWFLAKLNRHHPRTMSKRDAEIVDRLEGGEKRKDLLKEYAEAPHYMSQAAFDQAVATERKRRRCRQGRQNGL